MGEVIVYGFCIFIFCAAIIDLIKAGNGTLNKNEPEKNSSDLSERNAELEPNNPYYYGNKTRIREYKPKEKQLSSKEKHMQEIFERHKKRTEEDNRYWQEYYEAEEGNRHR